MINKYFDLVKSKMSVILDEEYDNLEKASTMIAKSIQNDGILYLFGCGHSHIFGEDLFFRAGGLAPIYPILHEPLMLHKGPVRSSQIERKNDYAEKFIEDYDITDKDTIIVISTSGINPVPIDVAKYAKSKGANIIVITSKEYSSSQKSRHKDKLKLYEMGDVVIDNKAPKGDAILNHPKLSTPFAPASSAIGIPLLQSIIAEAINKMINNGFEPPVFLSGNIAGSDNHNNELVNKYSKRIPLLKEGLAD